MELIVFLAMNKWNFQKLAAHVAVKRVLIFSSGYGEQLNYNIE